MSDSQYVKLNVGGYLFQTTRDTLTRCDTMLKIMFNGSVESYTDPDGWVLIDRCGKHFGTILNFLRDGSISLPRKDTEIEELLAEAEYYLIPELAHHCEEALRLAKNVTETIFKLTNPQQERQLISATTKPVVKLMIRRSPIEHCDCTLTTSSYENYLNNIELFHELSRTYYSLGHFIKNVQVKKSGVNSCAWTFYKNKKKRGFINCSSGQKMLVVNRIKRQTIINFPAKKIYSIFYELFFKDKIIDPKESRE